MTQTKNELNFQGPANSVVNGSGARVTAHMHSSAPASLGIPNSQNNTLPQAPPAEFRSAPTYEHANSRLALTIAGVLSLMCMFSGLYALVHGSSGASDLDFLGLKLSTGNVGVVLFALGIVGFVTAMSTSQRGASKGR